MLSGSISKIIDDSLIAMVKYSYSSRYRERIFNALALLNQVQYELDNYEGKSIKLENSKKIVINMFTEKLQKIFDELQKERDELFNNMGVPINLE